MNTSINTLFVNGNNKAIKSTGVINSAETSNTINSTNSAFNSEASTTQDALFKFLGTNINLSQIGKENSGWDNLKGLVSKTTIDSDSNNNAKNAVRGQEGLVDVTGKPKLGSQNSINPKTNNNFDDFKNYGRNELENYYGDLDAIRNRIGGNSDGVPDAVYHDFKEDSGFAKSLQDSGVSLKDTKNMWDRVSEINGYLFQEGTDKFANAMDSTSKKFYDAGASNLLTNIKGTVHDNAEVFAHAMKNNMSTDGIKDFKGIYDAYLQGRDNVANAGIVDRNAYNHFMQTGELKTSRDYGNLELSDAEMKDLGNRVNRQTFDGVLNAAGFDSSEVASHLRNKNGVEAMNNFDGTYFAAMGLTSMAANQDRNGQTGFDKLVADARARDGNAKAEYNAVGHVSFMNNSVDMNTDGTAFTRGEKGIIGLDGLTTFAGGGLRNNPLNPNVLVHGNQGSASSSDFAKIDSEMQAAQNAGINYRTINFDISGHGSRNQDGSAGVMMKSGIADDKNQFDFNDADKAASLLAKNIGNGGTVNITCDACEAAPLAKRIGELTAEKAQEMGKDIKVNYQGSQEYGLVSSHQMGETSNGDTRAVMNEDGTVNFFRFRGDHNDGDNNIQRDTLYSNSKESFEDTAAKFREENFSQEINTNEA